MKIRVQFEPFQTVASVGFWSTLGKHKLEVVRLTSRTLSVWGYWEAVEVGDEERNPKFFLDETSFSQPQQHQGKVVKNKRIWERGLVVFYETEKDFLDMDFQKICQEYFSDDCAFILFTLADLKKHVFKYYTAFPANVPAGSVYCTGIEKVAEQELQKALADSSFRKIDDRQVIFGWPIRRHLNKDHCEFVTVQHSNGMFKCRLEYLPQCTFIPGWESNQKGKVVLRTVDLAPLMDPIALAKNAANLNLKLIKWQLAPTLDLQKIQSCKCLLFGVGTLGCNVLRGLLGWGVRHLTLVDSGFCSFSNPVRQSFITIKDATDRLPKVEAVARNARLVDSSAQITALQLTIPMPGHLPDDDLLRDIDRIEELIKQHDCIFLLTDSRESRWLPTVLCALHSKMCFTIALGFDHFVAMQHGPSCYFCQDSIAPVDSVSNRTIDQQCTVSRPGLSLMASGIGVELMISSLDPKTFGSNLPQQIRGSMFSVNEIHGPQSDYCTACSQAVIDRCKDNLYNFMRNVFEDSLYLQSVTNMDRLNLSDDLFESFE